jgi:hypothetical protein
MGFLLEIIGHARSDCIHQDPFSGDSNHKHESSFKSATPSALAQSSDIQQDATQGIKTDSTGPKHARCNGNLS